MSVADRIEDHQARCRPHVVRLQMIARDPGAAGTRHAVAEVIGATRAILAEAAAAASDARAAAGSGRGADTFLGVRLSRLTAAADDAVAAAGAGDAASLRRKLRRFDALTAAIWTVQQSMPDPAPVPGPRS